MVKFIEAISRNFFGNIELQLSRSRTDSRWLEVVGKGFKHPRKTSSLREYAPTQSKKRWASTTGLHTKKQHHHHQHHLVLITTRSLILRHRSHPRSPLPFPFSSPQLPLPLVRSNPLSPQPPAGGWLHFSVKRQGSGPCSRQPAASLPYPCAPAPDPQKRQEVARGNEERERGEAHRMAAPCRIGVVKEHARKPIVSGSRGRVWSACFLQRQFGARNHRYTRLVLPQSHAACHRTVVLEGAASIADSPGRVGRVLALPDPVLPFLPMTDNILFRHRHTPSRRAHDFWYSKQS